MRQELLNRVTRTLSVLVNTVFNVTIIMKTVLSLLARTVNAVDHHRDNSKMVVPTTTKFNLHSREMLHRIGYSKNNDRSRMIIDR